jgi:hypothetical protein
VLLENESKRLENESKRLENESKIFIKNISVDNTIKYTKVYQKSYNI